VLLLGQQLRAVLRVEPTVANINEVHVRRWVNAREAAGARPKTIANYHGLLYMVLAAGVRGGLRNGRCWASGMRMDDRRPPRWPRGPDVLREAVRLVREDVTDERSHAVVPARPGRPRLVRAVLAVGLALVVLLVAVAVVPGLRAAAKAPFVLADALGSPVPRPWAPSVQRYEDDVGGVTVDRYSPGDSAPPLLVVPGAAQDGRDDSRVVSLARSLARAGRDVVVPELTLYQQELDVDDVDRVVRVAQALCPPQGGLVLLGLSYGGSLALVAAADERLAGCLDLVATFGAYADLVGVVQAAATGTSVVGGERHPWRAADESIARQVLQDAAVELVPEEQRRELRERCASRTRRACLPGPGRCTGW
jgi:hypothetical protein